MKLSIASMRSQLGGPIPSRTRWNNIASPILTRDLMLKHFKWNEVELETLKPDLMRQLVVGENMMIARVLLKKGCIVPEHSHISEQLTYILEGALKFTIDGKEVVVNAGEVLCIPPHMPHAAEAMEDTV